MDLKIKMYDNIIDNQYRFTEILKLVIEKSGQIWIPNGTPPIYRVPNIPCIFAFPRKAW